MNFLELPVKIDNTLKQNILEYARTARYDNSAYPISSKNFLNKHIIKATSGPQYVKNIPESIVENLLIKINVKPERILIIKNDPFFVTLPHIDHDSSKERKSCVTWAIYPDLDKFAPTLFYDEYDNIIGTYKYSDNAFILETGIRHGMVNNNNTRYSLQFTYSLEARELYERLKTG